MSVYAPKKPSRINGLNISLVLILSVLGYFGTWYLPHWFKVWSMVGAMQSIGTDAYREYNDEKLMDKLLKEARRIGFVGVTKENFVIERVPFTEEQIAAASAAGKNVPLMRKRGQEFICAFGVVMIAKWPFLEKETPLTFERQVKVDLAAITW